MSDIPLHTFRRENGTGIPFEIMRIEELPSVALSGSPKRTDFYEIYWLESDSGTLFIDFVGHPIRSNVFYFVAPYQVHYWDLPNGVNGYVLLFLDEFFHMAGLEYFLPSLDFSQVLSGNPAVVVSADERVKLDFAIQLIAEEYAQSDHGYSQAIVGLLQFLLTRVQRLAAAEWQTSPQNARDRLTQQFMILLEANFREQHNPKWYAQELGVTAGYLTKTIREVMGVTAGVLLRQRLIIEAKRWLVHSEWTVAQVADYLCFTDASYFGRFFRRETAVTPRTFRENFSKTYIHQYETR